MVYQRSDLTAFNLLKHPIYVFDVLRRRMWWANTAAVALWNASSTEELLERDFSSDMSTSSEQRMLEYIRRFQRSHSEVIHEQWTMYPAGKKVTVYATCTGIAIADDDQDASSGTESHLAILTECDLSTFQQEVDQASLRGVEMLRHLPVAVSQFTLQGQLMGQNPEALHLFGCLDEERDREMHLTDDETRVTAEVKQQQREDCQDDECKEGVKKQKTTENQSSRSFLLPNDKNTNNPGFETAVEEESNDFTRRFVNHALGSQILQQIAAGSVADYSTEAQQYTCEGPLWSLIKVRKSRDPVSDEPVILYAARDISAVIEAKNAADQANMEKSEMLGVLSHEIRTPLHHVTCLIELLSSTTLTAEQSDYVRSLQTATVSLLSIITDVLDFTKLEAGKMEIERIPFDPKAVCQGCLEVVGPTAEKKGLDLQWRYTDDGSLCDDDIDRYTRVLGDPNRIRQIILNLLSNAVKFTHKGSITLGLTVMCTNDNVDDSSNKTQNRARLVFSVADTGIGIRPEHVQHIFHKYRQSDAAVAREYGGTGLGLAICKILAKAMGGTLTLESNLNEGSEFTFEMLVDISLAEHEPSIPVQLEEGPTSLHILLVEDNKMNQKLAAAMLRRTGHSVEIVENGKLAVEAVLSEVIRYDLVLMDIQMPVLDGIEATKQLRELGWTKEKLPILGLTASFQTADLQYYQEIGMNDCIGKPVRLKALQDRLRRYNSIHVEQT